MMKKWKWGLLAALAAGTLGCASAPEQPDCNLNLNSCLLHWDEFISDKRTAMNMCVNEECHEKGEAFRQAEEAFVYSLYLQGKSYYSGQHVPR
jgi:hypothetical protein|tara:strand:+ start:5527 stop:5805 length:279 start_codon:yes stop_codon:yes gene_type:complete